MRTSHLSTLFLASALALAPSGAALAEPTPITSTTPARAADPARATSPAPISDAEQYAAREAKDQEVANFQGGSAVLVIGGSGLGIVLLVILLVILL